MQHRQINFQRKKDFNLCSYKSFAGCCLFSYIFMDEKQHKWEDDKNESEMADEQFAIRAIYRCM
jgi:hypothetical protein